MAREKLEWTDLWLGEDEVISSQPIDGLGFGNLDAEEADEDAYTMSLREEPPTIIVTRHAGLVEWLEQRGITGCIIEHATPDEIRGCRVYGVLPLYLAVLAESVTTVDIPDLPADRRGQDLTPKEMDAYGASMTTYIVREQEAQ